MAGWTEGVKRYRRDRLALLAEVAALPDEIQKRRSAPGQWNILEIMEHLVVAERFVFQGMPPPDQLRESPTAEGATLRRMLVLAVLGLRIPVKTPSEAMVPTGTLGLDALRIMWTENADWLHTCAEHLGPAGVRKPFFSHPVTGPLNLPQALALGRVHFEGHRKQIRARSR